ncbi:Beta-N-acetylglucosaminidase [Arcticibacter svalbardensis MN12-7]|uniref:Beta-N-acetylglucosaminidase n=1 Tax=Arcticibacter svalbardensis MN12-7 TaxID=1150600 RepID=R9GW17_9SPHI|nr:serine hydrolase [Arcticibacter svalbardensis]EOR93114.1 Beta-N-acetylglucosaminidase [Arcticibacter svalbardensis MN12-7]
MKKAIVLVLILLSAVSVIWAQNAPLKLLQEEQTAAREIVVLTNGSQLLPLVSLQDLKIATVHIHFKNAALLDSMVNKYYAADAFNTDTIKGTNGYNALNDRLKLYNFIIFALSDQTPVSADLINLIQEKSKTGKAVVVFTGRGKSLARLNTLTTPVLWYKSDTQSGASVAAQLIFGGRSTSNRLQETFSPGYKKGAGTSISKIRLQYTLPEDAGINSQALRSIDAVVEEGIKARAMPGAVVLVVKDGKVVFHQAYGKHTYDGNEVMKQNDIFDLASVTKISATTMAVMRLYEQKRIQLDSPISKYIALTRSIPDKKNIAVREVMLHQAGFTPFIPFYEHLKPSDTSKDSSSFYSIKVADGYFIRGNYFDEVMWPEMLNSKVVTRGKYVYSDLSMYFMREIIEKATHEKLNAYTLKEFYNPLGLQATGFLPRNRFPKNRIVPTTEKDSWFRNMLLQGFVHDPGAAMAGGVSGHAGLFANANDLAILFQMVLNKGTYGGRSYFEPATINLFTSRQSTVSRRGLGFDRWDPDTTLHYPSALASDQTFGHTGYTGTCIWVDPKYNLIYIFLSNRVYPEVIGNKLQTLNIRGRIQDIIYKAILTKN